MPENFVSLSISYRTKTNFIVVLSTYLPSNLYNTLSWPSYLFPSTSRFLYSKQSVLLYFKISSLYPTISKYSSLNSYIRLDTQPLRSIAILHIISTRTWKSNWSHIVKSVRSSRPQFVIRLSHNPVITEKY